MTGVFIEYSPSILEDLHRYVFQLTGKGANIHTPPVFPIHYLILIEIRNDGVHLIRGASVEEGAVLISLPEALTYIRKQLFIQSLEN